MQKFKINSSFTLHRVSDLGIEIPFPNYKHEGNGKRTVRWYLMSLGFYFLFFMDEAFFRPHVGNAGWGVFLACPVPDHSGKQARSSPSAPIPFMELRHKEATHIEAPAEV